MIDLKEKKVTIIGGRRSGMALARLITAQGGRAKISEQANEDSLSSDFKQWAKAHQVAIEFNGHTHAFIEDSDLVVLSPGVRLSAPPVVWAKDKNIPVLGEIEFAYQFCRKPIIAVTGSNGKTTVVTLLHQVLQKGGYRSCLCGNVGMPFSEFVLQSDQKDFFVLEISSFQLESLLEPQSIFRSATGHGQMHFKGFKPHIAVILNFSQNHLDRHKDLQEYFEAKTRIFLNQTKADFAVLNERDERLKNFAPSIQSKVVFFNQSQRALEDRTNPNQLVVLEVARLLNIKEDICRQVFADFKGVEHRLEFVRQINGVKFLNDSKATTAEAGGWALQSINQPIVMICGGRDKNIDFSVVKDLVGKKVRKMLIIGEATQKLKTTFDRVVALEECGSLQEAVQKAKEEARAGDCVVLSPMCASFDMFTDYEDRGRKFKEMVHRL